MPTSYGLSYSMNSLPRMRMDDRRLKGLGEGEDLRASIGAAGAGQDRHTLRGVERTRRCLDLGVARPNNGHGWHGSWL